MRISDWSSDVCSSDLCLILPERDSSDDSAVRANLLAQHLGVRVHTHDIAPALAAIGCYEARDDAVRTVLPGYGEGWKFKIAIAGGTQGLINRFRIRSEEHTSETPVTNAQIVCRLLLENKKNTHTIN